MCCEEDNLPDDYNDDCDEFDFIDEEIYVSDFTDYDVDEHLSKAWTFGGDGFVRSDYNYHEEREFRVFPTRYRLNEFKFTKSLRRVMNKNRDLKMIVRPFRSTEGKDDLLTGYHQKRFQSDQERHSLKNSFEYLKYSDVRVMEACVFKDNKIAAFSVFFLTERSAIGRIGCWNTEITDRRLGILTILLEIQYAKKMNLEHYYLGDYLSKDPHYRYKLDLPALEMWDWDNEKWLDYKTERERIEEMYNHKFRCLDDLEKNPKFTMSLLQSFVTYRKYIAAAAFIGSRARGDVGEDSDYDVLILCEDTRKFLEKKDDIVKCFHRWRESKIEERGSFKVLRSFYKNGDIYEFNVAPTSWADTPATVEARRIVKDGIKILHDPQGILENLQKAVIAEDSK